jgi:hypothetical protein
MDSVSTDQTVIVAVSLLQPGLVTDPVNVIMTFTRGGTMLRVISGLDQVIADQAGWRV